MGNARGEVVTETLHHRWQFPLVRLHEVLAQLRGEGRRRRLVTAARPMSTPSRPPIDSVRTIGTPVHSRRESQKLSIGKAGPALLMLRAGMATVRLRRCGRNRVREGQNFAFGDSGEPQFEHVPVSGASYSSQNRAPARFWC